MRRAFVWLLFKLCFTGGVVVCVILTPPAKGKIDNRTGLFDLIERPQGLKHHSFLLGKVPWLPDRMTERPVQEDRPWGLNLFRIFANN